MTMIKLGYFLSLIRQPEIMTVITTTLDGQITKAGQYNGFTSVGTEPSNSLPRFYRGLGGGGEGSLECVKPRFLNQTLYLFYDLYSYRPSTQQLLNCCLDDKANGPRECQQHVWLPRNSAKQPLGVLHKSLCQAFDPDKKSAFVNLFSPVRTMLVHLNNGIVQNKYELLSL